MDRPALLPREVTMSTTATHTRRFTPPTTTPTRKPASPRPLRRHGASVVGRADRPVLRIVADDERAPVLTRVLPSVEPVDTTRRVDLDEFFVADYDGDDQRLEVVRPRPSSVRLTRRGRLVVFAGGLAAALGFGFLLASQSMATDHGEQTRVVVVQPGQTLWDISSRAAAATGGGDVRSMMSHVESINHLGSTTLQPGQRLHVPR
jgi:hypothetical protein